MRKDIEIPEVKNVYVAALEVTDEHGDTTWWMHLINDTNGPLENILVQSKGYSDLETKAVKALLRCVKWSRCSLRNPRQS